MTAEPRLVVGVGASAGGLQAFRDLLRALPNDSGFSFIFVQHLDPEHQSLLTELLAPSTVMPVRDAQHGERIARDTVHVIKPGCSLAVRKGIIELSEPSLHQGVRLPVDHLFRSLATQYGSRSVGIVLTGAGSDGSSGLRDIKTVGGMTIAQQLISSDHPDMPRSAIGSGYVDLVLPIDRMPQALSRFAAMPSSAHLDQGEDMRETDEASRDDMTSLDDRGTNDVPAEALTDESLSVRVHDEADLNGNTLHGSGSEPSLDEVDVGSLTALMSAHTEFDISIYKPRTIQRRVARRMLLSGFNDVPSYMAYLRTESAEQQAMLRDLLISVTSFFRDTHAFDTLKECAIEPRVRACNDGDRIRIWVAGCATGEEAYSIGMAFLDVAAETNRHIELQIFATDIDSVALAVAREGIYSAATLEHLPAWQLERHFEPMDGRGYRVRSQLRDAISFALHDLTKDPPFSRMDLVSCRNVMIYFTPAAQKQVLGALHFALQDEGLLFLSTSESIGARPELFVVESKSAHIYRKSGVSRHHALPGAGVRESSSASLSWQRRRTNRRERPSDEQGRLHDPLASDPARHAVLQAWAPPTIIVDDTGLIVFMHGELSPYLQFPQGEEPRMELNAMLRPELATRTLGALYRCRRENEEIAVTARSEDEGLPLISITAKPATGLGTGCVMLSFSLVNRSSTALSAHDGNVGKISDAAIDGSLVKRLDAELKATRDDLRSTVQELESTNEQLRTSNEESMSMNEELQSSNEELEATTEELRSLNEELSTVNTQLREKIQQLEITGNDLRNFFASAQVPILFLDEELRIKRFTPAAARLLSIDLGDVGRPTGDIARELLQHELLTEATTVLATLESRSADLQTEDRRWFHRRVLPYLTENRKVEGVVVTLSDITDRKTASELLKTREAQQRVIARLGLSALHESNLQQFLDDTIEDVLQTLDLDLCKILELQPGGQSLLLRAGSGWKEGLVGRNWVDAGVQSHAGYTLTKSRPVIVDDLPTEKRFTGSALLTDHHVVSGVSCVIGFSGRTYGVLGVYMTRPRRFSNEDADFIQSVANIIGTIINNHEERLRRSLESLVTGTVASSDSAVQMKSEMVNALTDRLECEAGELWWFDEQRHLERIHLHTSTAMDSGAIGKALTRRNRDEDSPDGLVQQVLDRSASVWMTDIGVPGLHDTLAGLKDFGITTAFGLPVRDGESIIGVITLFASRRMFSNEQFLLTLDKIGTAMGLEIDRMQHEEREQRLAAITDASHDAIFSLDNEGRVTEWLSGAERLYGYSDSEMIGRQIDTIIPESEQSKDRAMTRLAIDEQVFEPFESRRMTRDAGTKEVSVLRSPIRSASGRITTITSTERDITHLKETERRLLDADQQKNEFLAMLGHELRNPLSSMRTAAELLRELATDDEEVQRARAVFERQTAHMASLLDGLLDVSRIIHGKIVLDVHTVDMVEICREVMTDAQRRAIEAGLSLEMILPEEAVPIEADRIRMVQIVDNLLSNALRYSRDEGHITLTLTRRGEQAHLLVADDGIGMDPTKLPRIFDVFWQSDQSLDRSRGGMGIGLALVKTLTDMHQGTIEARSDGPGKGAEFELTLPVSHRQIIAKQARPRQNDSGLHVLIIEDNQDSADMIGRVLQRNGHTVTAQPDGTRGIQFAIEGRPDLVLCDLGLPDGVTGYDVARTLSEDQRTADIPLIALSGYGGAEVKQQCADAGFHTHLTKPVGIAELLEVVTEGR